MPIMSGWEVSPDRIEKYDKIMSIDDVGEPIITSKCKLGPNNGYIVASNNGFAWRIERGGGFSKWIRWHDVDRIDLKREGFLLAYIKVREKNGILKLDGKGIPKLKKLALQLRQNNNEEYGHYLQRRSNFYQIISDIFNRNKGDTDPPTSDTRL